MGFYMQNLRKLILTFALVVGLVCPSASVFASNFHLILGADYVNSHIKYNHNKEAKQTAKPDSNYHGYSPVIGINAYGISLEAFLLNTPSKEKDSIETKIRAYGFDIIGEASLSDNFTVLASLGLAKYEFNTKSKNKNQSPLLKSKTDDSNNGPRFGIGLQYYISRNFAIRAMYHYTLLNSGDKDLYDAVSEFSAGLRFYF